MTFRPMLAALCLAATLATPALSQPMETRQVQFDAGTSGTVIRDSITGYEGIDYKLGASAGQRMVVDLNTSNLSNYFNIMAPGADSALFVGASDGTHFDGILPANGEYTIRVFLMRNAARREETADYSLSIHIGGAITPPEPDFADGNAGGPDFWEVTASGLNIRSGPSADGAVVGRANHGQVLRNLGCRGSGDGRWCHVQTPDGALDGWVSGAYLRESGGPAASGQPGVSIPSSSPVAPSLYVRPTGEVEASWSSGCTVLFNPEKQRINAGSSCSEAELIASDLWVARMQ
ncbi:MULTISPECIES: SH3 domain-containing protein [unclassified Salipiger]|uniref:SH3 domain-containing protein n=1 Tax=unclassified Salipiger TaxID=2640570 RepID=UPI0013B771B2|nr:MULTISPECIES: SH3 domain-containing protein [unclassified Salipiger]NDV49725.1 SH3 domain-containing protein [Salipiger sp. PrR003]NDW33499.1 SH3 domain-containing protein [Salipiger sp. PrR007]